MLADDLAFQTSFVPQCINTTCGFAEANAVCRLLMFGQYGSHVRAFVTFAATSVTSELL